MLERGIWFSPAESYRPYRDSAMVEWSNKAELEATFNQLKMQTDREMEERGFRQDQSREAPRHVHWLYLHICPQPDLGRPWGWPRIAEHEHINHPAVKRAVERLAEDLEIRLPVLRGGRPPKFT